MDADLPARQTDVKLQTLKSFAYAIFEVSRQFVVTEIWSADEATEAMLRQRFANGLLANITNGPIIEQTLAAIRKNFDTEATTLIEYKTVIKDEPVRFLVRVMPGQDRQHVWLVVEKLHEAATDDIVEDKWKLALDASGDGMWDVNSSTGRIFFSDRWHQMFGYAPEEIRTNEDWRSKIHPDDIPVAEKKLEAYLKGDMPMYSAEIRYRCKDGSYKWILSRGIVASRDEDGKPNRFIGTHVDIHQRKVNEHTLAEREAWLRVLFDYSGAFICTHDVNGVILNVNAYAADRLGYERQELVGRRVSDLMPVAMARKFAGDYLAKVTEDGSADGIMQIVSKQGDVHYLLYRNHLFNNEPGEPYVIAFAQDATERVKAEEALKTSMELFSSVFQHSGIGIALLSPEGNWLDVNDSLLALTEYTREELLHLSFQDITHPDDLEDDLHLVRQMLARKIDSYTLEKRYITKSRSTKWVFLTVSLVWNSDGTPRFFISQIIDVSANKQLRDEINDKNAQLERTQKNLVNKIRQLEEMSYIIGHNLRGPASNIKLLTEVMTLKLGGMSDDESALLMQDSLETEEISKMIGDASKALTNTLEMLLSLSQIRLNKKIPYDDCDVPSIIERISMQLRATILEKSAVIEQHLQQQVVSYPLAYFENILYNLISNALKYARPGVPPVVAVTIQTEDGRTVLSVKDNGQGMDLEKYSDRLFRLNRTFHNHKDSKGIGLYMIKNQIEFLGGSISATSKVNTGTEFRVVL